MTHPWSTKSENANSTACQTAIIRDSYIHISPGPCPRYIFIYIYIYIYIFEFMMQPAILSHAVQDIAFSNKMER